MKKLSSRKTLLPTVFATGLFASTAAQAQTVTIVNSSFERRDIGTNGSRSVDGVVEDWFDASGKPAADNPADGLIVNESLSGTPNAPDGNQWLQLNNNDFIWQEVTTIAANTDYELSLTIGRYETLADSFQYGFYADSGNRGLESLTIDSSNTGLTPADPDTILSVGDKNTVGTDLNSDPSFTTQSIVFSSTSLPSGIAVGDRLFVGLEHEGGGGVVLFDDLSLTATPIPEPSVFGLLAGCLALGHVMVRRRRRD